MLNKSLILRLDNKNINLNSLSSIISSYCISKILNVNFFITIINDEYLSKYSSLIINFIKFHNFEIIKTINEKYIYHGNIDPNNFIETYLDSKYIENTLIIDSYNNIIAKNRIINSEHIYYFTLKLISKNNDVNIVSIDDILSFNEFYDADVLISKKYNDIGILMSIINSISYLVIDLNVDINLDLTNFTEICYKKMYHYGDDWTYVNMLIKKYIKKEIIILLVNNGDIFNNGCMQQAYFIYEYFQNTIYKDKVQFGSLTNTDNKYVDVDVRNLIKSNLYDVHTIINVSLSYPNIFLYDLYGINVIDIFCGNLYILQQEQYIFSKTNKTLITDIKKNICSKIYTFPMYKDHIHYLKLLYNKDVNVIPHYWSSSIIDKYIEKSKIVLKNSDTENSDFCISIFEPNISIHKSSFVPIIMCEKLYNENSIKMKVIVYCSNNNIISSINNMNLNIIKDNIVEFKQRIKLIDALNSTNEYKNIILSHNIMNDMNFLHMELIYLKYPIIHNCKSYDNGLYYENEFRGYELLLDTIMNYNLVLKKIENYTINNNHGYDNIDKYIINNINKLEEINLIKNPIHMNIQNRENLYIYYTSSDIINDDKIMNILNEKYSKSGNKYIICDKVNTLEDNLSIAIKYREYNLYFETIINSDNVYKIIPSENLIFLFRYHNIILQSKIDKYNKYLFKINEIELLFKYNYHHYFNDDELLFISNYMN